MKVTEISPILKIILSVTLTFKVFLINELSVAIYLLIPVLITFTLLKAYTFLNKWMWSLLFSGYPFLFIIFFLSYIDTQNIPESLKLSLIESLLFFIKMKILLMINLIVIKTTTLKVMCESLQSINIPSKLIIFMISIIRFIPITFEESKNIISAQKLRGIKFKYTTDLPGLLIPLLISNLRKSHDMALCLEIRYFNWKLPIRQSKTKKLTLGNCTIFILIILVIIMR